MSRLSKCLLFLCCAGLVSTAALAAKDPNIDAIKARKGEMQIRSLNAGPLFAMARGKIPYDAGMAAMLAGNLKTMLNLDMGRAWPQGSDLDSYFGETNAKPELWANYPKILDYRKSYATAVNELAAVAGNGQDALRSKVGALGKSCKGCHDAYQAD